MSVVRSEGDLVIILVIGCSLPPRFRLPSWAEHHRCLASEISPEYLHVTRAPIDRPVTRESSGDPNLVGDRAAHAVCHH